MMKRISIIISLAFVSLFAYGQITEEHEHIGRLTGMDPTKIYNASIFGVKSNGLYDNTSSFQKAVDFISENGGGVLYISVGRYLTGAVQLKDNVTVYIRGTVVGSPNIFDYQGQKAIFWADGAENIAVINGVIEGNGPALRNQVEELREKGLISDDCVLPTLIYFKDCKNAKAKKVVCRYAATSELYISDNSDADFENCIDDTVKLP